MRGVIFARGLRFRSRRMKIKNSLRRKLRYLALRLASLVAEMILWVSATGPYNCTPCSFEYPFLSPPAEGTGNIGEESEPADASGGTGRSIRGVLSRSPCPSRRDESHKPTAWGREGGYREVWASQSYSGSHPRRLCESPSSAKSPSQIPPLTI